MNNTPVVLYNGLHYKIGAHNRLYKYANGSWFRANLEPWDERRVRLDMKKKFKNLRAA